MKRPRAAPVPTLVVMAKVPSAGRVKTRLARGIGPVAATSFYRHALTALTTRLARPRRWRLVLAVAPASEFVTRALPPGTTRIPQSNGDLGRRMQTVFDRLGRAPVVIVGSDILNITERDIAAAFQRLAGHEAVFGPAPDGGYWLIGLSRRKRRLTPFSAVRWSTENALTDTRRNLTGCRVALLSEKTDIDDAEAWSHTGHLRGRRIVPPENSQTRPPTGLRSRSP